MSDIEVGEYVRLARNQGINKIIEIEEDGFLILDDVIADEWGDETDRISPQDIDEEIVNHSKELIDLIEIGDYVNGEKINYIKNYDGKKCVAVENSEGLLEYCFNNEDIKSIVTKEQFKGNSYEVK